MIVLILLSIVKGMVERNVAIQKGKVENLPPCLLIITSAKYVEYIRYCTCTVQISTLERWALELILVLFSYNIYLYITHSVYAMTHSTLQLMHLVQHAISVLICLG